MPELFIGLMSGTSLDGIDAVLADFGSGAPRLLAADHRALVPALRAQLMTLQTPSANELHHASLAANALSQAYAGSVECVLAAAHVAPGAVQAIGCHGQTIRHEPASGYTVQLVNGALLAELTGINVVSDFRSRDIAAGGQGAPLAPAFHQAVFGSETAHRAILNLGGIANITDLQAGTAAKGFDCGPGNVLMDAWIARHKTVAFDADGAWAASGRLVAALLDRMRAHQFFSRPPPKSTGRETFNLAWVDSLLAGDEAPADVQRTLLALTVATVADAIVNYCGGVSELYVCGGGARNGALLHELSARLAPRRVETTDTLGIAAEHVEALAFAWLARQNLNGAPGNLPAVSGSRGPRVLGALHRA